MISFTSITGTYPGVMFEMTTGSEIKKILPRVSKTKTLDGAVVIDHRGVIDGDRELDINALVDIEQETLLRNLFDNETFLHCSCEVGFFKGVVSKYQVDNGKLSMTFWVAEKLNE